MSLNSFSKHMFETKLVEKIKTCFVFNNFFFFLKLCRL
jgi:hypothetical protein